MGNNCDPCDYENKEDGNSTLIKKKKTEEVIPIIVPGVIGQRSLMSNPFESKIELSPEDQNFKSYQEIQNSKITSLQRNSNDVVISNICKPSSSFH